MILLDNSPPVKSLEMTLVEVFEDAKKCHGDACHALVVVGFDAILRCAEVTSLAWGDYDDGELDDEGAKGSNNATIELSPGAVCVLEEYRDLVRDRFDDPRYLFYRFTRNYRWNEPWSA